MASFLAEPLGGKASSLVGAVHQNTLTEEEKKEHEYELAKAARHADKPEKSGPAAGRTDIADAREAERRMRDAENAGWLEKNIHSILAFCIMLITFILYIVVIYASTRPDFKNSEAKDIVIYILGALTTVATQVVSYYFGSSSGSADKSRALSAIAKRG